MAIVTNLKSSCLNVSGGGQPDSHPVPAGDSDSELSVVIPDPPAAVLGIPAVTDTGDWNGAFLSCLSDLVFRVQQDGLITAMHCPEDYEFLLSADGLVGKRVVDGLRLSRLYRLRRSRPSRSVAASRAAEPGSGTVAEPKASGIWARACTSLM